MDFFFYIVVETMLYFKFHNAPKTVLNGSCVEGSLRARVSLESLLSSFKLSSLFLACGLNHLPAASTPDQCSTKCQTLRNCQKWGVPFVPKVTCLYKRKCHNLLLLLYPLFHQHPGHSVKMLSPFSVQLPLLLRMNYHCPLLRNF